MVQFDRILKEYIKQDWVMNEKPRFHNAHHIPLCFHLGFSRSPDYQPCLIRQFWADVEQYLNLSANDVYNVDQFCMYVCMYIYICIYIWDAIHIKSNCLHHIWSYTTNYNCVYIYILISVFIYTCTYMHTYIRIYIYTYIHTYIYIHIHTYIYIYTYIYIHT